MTLVSTHLLMDRAVRAGRAVPAFNAITLEHAEAIVEGAAVAQRTVIIQLSENAARFHGSALRPVIAAFREVAIGSDVDVALHLDHFEDEALLVAAIADAHELGVGSIMIDASRKPYVANVETTARLARRARDAGLWVEAELGEIGGKDGAHAPGARTDPHEAAEFVAATGVDGLAVAVGSSHAMTERSARLDLGLIARLDEAVHVPLVLHGSSGVADEALQAAAAAGIRKVNVGTALNIAGTVALRAALAERPDAVDPRRALASSRSAMAIEVARLAELF